MIARGASEVMKTHLERDLDAVQKELFAMALEVEEAILNAALSIQNRDTALAKRVIDSEPRIDADENYLEEECLKIIALHQPVAIDLRRVATAIAINTDLERMADLAEEIAERALSLATLPAVKVPEKFQRMTDIVITMVRQSLDCFFHLDPHQARRVCRLDDEVDRYNDDIISDLIAMMQASPKSVEPGLSLFSATRHLERIADHASNIAEDVVYLVEGTVIRHNPAALDDEQ